MVKQVIKPGEVQRSLKKFNLVMVKDNFVPETCEYYLHYNVSRPLPKKWTWSAFFFQKKYTHSPKKKKSFTIKISSL